MAFLRPAWIQQPQSLWFLVVASGVEGCWDIRLKRWEGLSHSRDFGITHQASPSQPPVCHQHTDVVCTCHRVLDVSKCEVGHKTKHAILLNHTAISHTSVKVSHRRSGSMRSALLLLFSRSVVSDSVTPWTAACQASLSLTLSLSWLKLMFFELVMPSNHLILCHSLFLLPSIFPSIRVFSNE